MLFRQSKIFKKTSNSRFHNFDVQAGGWGGGAVGNQRHLTEKFVKVFKITSKKQRIYKNLVFKIKFSSYISNISYHIE
jgi:hypothetical protein